MNKEQFERFIEQKVVSFFTENTLTNMTVKDDNGNKSKLTINKKTGEVKIENSYEKVV